MYYVLFNIHIYCIQKKTSGLQRCLSRVTFREGFYASLKGFKTVLSPQTIFCTLIFIRYLYTCVLYKLVHFLHFVFDDSMLQARNFYSLFYLFTEYVVYSLPLFPSFSGQVLLGVAIAFAPLNCNGIPSLLLGCRWFFLFFYPLDRFYKPPCFLCNFIWFYDDTYVLFIVRVFDTD